MARARIDAAQGRAAVLTVLEARGRGQVMDRATTGTAVRFLLQTLVDRAPGHSVEVRIPPYAAAQAVAGPRHRRGTPSAVIEMDADTWLDLATGAVGWAQALAGGRIHASGERADLAPWLPIVGMP